VFDQISGLPVHVLVLHAAVVFVPLLALGAIVYGVVPRWRPRTGWAVLLLSIITPVTCFVTRQSGVQFYQRIFPRSSPRGKEMLNEHMHFGTLTFWFVLALGIVTLVSVILTNRRSASLPRAADLGLAVVMVALDAISSYYVFRTGDSGAHVAWGTY
jgi:uncharacterized membrane protein